jgi:hypothetical protein
MGATTNYGALDSSTRCPSQGLWYDCPQDAIRNGEQDGIIYFDDFLQLAPNGSASGDIYGWTLTEVTDGVTASASGEGGVFTITTGGNAAGRGHQLQLGPTNTDGWLPAAGKTLWFETRVKVAAITATPELFLGFHITDTTIIASGALATTGDSYAGFYISRTNGTGGVGTVTFASAKAGTEKVDYTATTFAAGTYVKLGFRIVDLDKIEIYVNGTKLGTDVAAAYVPAVVMRPSIVAQDSTTAACTFTCDWVKCAQVTRAS